MGLFQYRTSLLHSGEVSNYKIECEALTPRDWHCLARLVEEQITFGTVVGIPKGGIPFQHALEPYATGGADDPLLIVDDVYTRGSSMRAAYDEVRTRWNGVVIGVVVFARNPITEDWIRAIWSRTY